MCLAQQDVATSMMQMKGVTLATAHGDVRQLTHQGRVYALHGDQVLVDYCRQCRPDLVLFDPPPFGTTWPAPSSLAMAYIAWKLGIPVVCLLHGSDPAVCQWVDRCYPMCQSVVMIDGLCPFYHTPAPQRYSWNWWPIVSCCDANQPEDGSALDVVVPGRLIPGSSPDRLVRALDTRGVHVTVTDVVDKCLSCSDVDLIRRARVVINPFPWRHRLVFESCLRGALLVDDHDSPTWRVLVPDTEYLSMSDPAAMADRVAWYVRHEEARLALAESGRQHVRATYTMQHWWKKMFFLVFGAKSIVGEA